MSKLTPSKRTLSVALSLLLVASTGAIGAAAAAPTDSGASAEADAQTTAPDETNLTAEEILAAHQDRVESMETVSMTVHSNMSSDSYSSSSTQSIWIDFNDSQMRTEMNSEYANTTTVRNETGSITYDADDNVVRNSSFTFEDMDPRETSRFAVLLNNEVELTYEATETVDGTETYRLDADPQYNYTSGEIEATIWLDSETYMPVQYESSMDSDRYSYETTVQFDDVRVNETIPDERFSIDVPADAERPEDTTPDFESYDSESALRENTTQSVPDPDVPENYTFDSGYVTDGEEFSSIALSYTDGDDGSISVSQYASSGDTNSYYSESDSFENVSIGNQTAYYNEYSYGESNTSVLVWNDGDRRYSIYGSESQSTVIDIAESLIASA